MVFSLLHFHAIALASFGMACFVDIAPLFGYTVENQFQKGGFDLFPSAVVLGFDNVAPPQINELQRCNYEVSAASIAPSAID